MLESQETLKIIQHTRPQSEEEKIETREVHSKRKHENLISGLLNLSLVLFQIYSDYLISNFR